MSVRDFEAERRRHHQELDAAYRAIGRYVVEFSLMVACMKLDIADRIAEADSRWPAQLVVGEAPAKQISDAFFAVCMSVGELDESERMIVGKIRDRVDKEITRRNDFAHGDWFMALGPPDIENPASLVLTRTKASRRKTPASADGFSSTDLDALTENVIELRRWILDVGDVCLFGSERRNSGHRIRDYFEIGGKDVKRLPLLGPRSGGW
jgi:hypothetical protein